jgi:hypothetical protein
MTFTSYSLSVTVLISICFFSSSDPKGHVSFCRHLLSVVFTFQSSPLKLSSTWSVGTKLCRNIVRKVLYKKKSSFNFDRTKHIATLMHSCFWLDTMQKTSNLKLLCQLKPSIVGIVFGRSSTKLLHFILIGQQTWLPQAFPVSYLPIYTKIFF